MDHNKSPLERAFEIAKSGECETVSDIRDRLRAEGYDHRQLEGPVLAKQILEMIRRARTNA